MVRALETASRRVEVWRFTVIVKDGGGMERMKEEQTLDRPGDLMTDGNGDVRSLVFENVQDESTLFEESAGLVRYEPAEKFQLHQNRATRPSVL